MSVSTSTNWNTARASVRAVFRRSAAVSTAAPDDLRRAVPMPSERTLLRVSGWAMVIFACLAAGFVVHLTLISHLAEQRSQSSLFTQFRAELAGGTAPVGQVDAHGDLLASGTPVALVSIPSIGLSQTVVEGTSSRDLLDGPGHRRDTPLPGQEGVSVVYGRQAAYGGPFRSISTLKLGDTITTTTGQGTATFKVSAIRVAGSKVAPLAVGSGRLTLVTSSGSLFSSGTVVRVDADLVGTTFATPQPVLLPASLGSDEEPLGSDSSGWLPLLGLLELAILVGVGLVWSLRRWGRWHTWIVAVPVILAVGAEIGKQAVVVLPNLY